MTGLQTLDTQHQPHRSATASKAPRRRFIVRDWSEEKYDLPVRDYTNRTPIRVAPEDSIVIINSVGNRFYAARDWFPASMGQPRDDDEWAAVAWKFLRARDEKNIRNHKKWGRS
jgi:hypothetical protein